VAGIDTSSHTAAFAIYNLGKYPEIKVILFKLNIFIRKN
jgi:hypothetical protein